VSAGRAFVNVRGWPGRHGWKPPTVPSTLQRLGDRLAIVVVALPELGTIPERVGLVAWLLVLCEQVLAAGFAHADDLIDRHAQRHGDLIAWADTHPVRTAAGVIPWKVEAVTPFCQARKPRGMLYRAAYVGRGVVVGADLGRTFGLLAQWWRPARRRGFADGFVLGLPGWGEVTDRGGRLVWNPDVGAPMLYAAALGVRGVHLAFGGARGWKGHHRGLWDRDAHGRRHPYPGRFADLVATSFALDGVDSDALSDHLPAWGIKAIEPHAVHPDAAGAAHAAQLLDAQHRLVIALDAEAARWRVGL